MKQPVAITGATGFVGGHLLDALLARGQSVRVLVRDRARFNCKSDMVEVVEGDLDDLGALKILVMDSKAVVHCAGAIAGVDRESFFAINKTGTENIAELAAADGVKNFIHVSSLAAREPQLSHYAASKKAGEDAVARGIKKKHLTIVRPPAVYGPGDRATLGLFKALTQRRAILPGRADQRVSWLFVKDLAALLSGLTESGPLHGRIVEIDDGHKGGYSFADLVRLAGEVQGKQIALTLLPRAVVALAGQGAKLVSRARGRALILSPEKVNELYHSNWVASGAQVEGWQPQIQFREGFALTLGWYRQNGWLPGGQTQAKSQTNSKSNHGEAVK